MPLVQHVLALGPLDNRTYLVTCEATRETAVLDVGFDAPAAIEAVRRLGLQVRWLLATHGHYDHVAGMREVQDALGGDFWLHPDDRPLFDHLSEQGAAFGFPPVRGPDVVHELADGQRLAVGEETLEVLHTPGHSPGGVCFRWQRDLWAGDTLFAGSVGRTDLPGGSSADLVRAIRTRLFPLGDEVRVHPGHGPGTTIGRERRFNPFLGEEAETR